MREIRTFALTSALIMGTLAWVTGCAPATSTDELTKGDQAAGQGDVEAAKRDYDAALRKAQKEGQSADSQQAIEAKIAKMQAAIDAKRIANEDQSRQAALAALKAAKASADAHDLPGMMKSLSAAQGLGKAANDPQLNAELDRMSRSRAVALMRTQSIYQSMCNEAGWSIGLRWADVPGTWLVEFGSFSKDQSLKRAAAEVGDAELITQAGKVADSWTRYLEYKYAQRQTKDDTSTLGSIVNVVATAGKWKNLMDYLGYQKSFEKRMSELMGQSTLPDVQYAPVSRAAPAAPIVAGGPAAPGTSGGGGNAGGASGTNGLGGSSGGGGPGTGGQPAGTSSAPVNSGSAVTPPSASPVDPTVPGFGGVERH